jgi:hypothetical protein
LNQHDLRQCAAAVIRAGPEDQDRYLKAKRKMGGKARALPPPCPWVVLKLLQSCSTVSNRLHFTPLISS